LFEDLTLFTKQTLSSILSRMKKSAQRDTKTKKTKPIAALKNQPESSRSAKSRSFTRLRARYFAIIAIPVFTCVLILGYFFWAGVSLNRDIETQSHLETSRIASREKDVSKEQREQLVNLGYVTSKNIDNADLGKDGVTIHEEGRAFSGVNVYCSENSGELQFMDMQGNVIHRVNINTTDARLKDNQCKTVSFDKNGNFVMVIENTALVKSDLQGKELWRLKGRFHHDVDVMDDGTVFALLAERMRPLEQFDARKNLIDTLIVRISPNGIVESTLSLGQMIEQVPALMNKALAHIDNPRFRSELKPEYLKRDVFHTNTIEVIRRDIEEKGKVLFKAGWIMVCPRHLDSIVVVDPDAKRIMWHWGEDELQWPHDPSLLADGTVMVFDNGVGLNQSRVIQVSPGLGKITRTFVGDPPSSFFSETRGSAQLLANGNRLICDSEKGRAFEVDDNDNIVWEFWNPDRDAAKQKRATMFRFNRFDRKMNPFLNGILPPGH
jgi:hypothetical protein